MKAHGRDVAHAPFLGLDSSKRSVQISRFLNNDHQLLAAELEELLQLIEVFGIDVKDQAGAAGFVTTNLDCGL